MPAAAFAEASKHLLLPDECQLGYLFHMVAANLGLSPRSFDLWSHPSGEELRLHPDWESETS
eukprot:1926317-Prorocentrum_lima.AAC.1